MKPRGFETKLWRTRCAAVNVSQADGYSYNRVVKGKEKKRARKQFSDVIYVLYFCSRRSTRVFFRFTQTMTRNKRKRLFRQSVWPPAYRPTWFSWKKIKPLEFADVLGRKVTKALKLTTGDAAPAQEKERHRNYV